MLIGVLDESIVPDAVDLIMEHGKFKQVEVINGSRLKIEATPAKIAQVSASLIEDHGLYLIADGDTYIIGSQMNEEAYGANDQNENISDKDIQQAAKQLDKDDLEDAKEDAEKEEETQDPQQAEALRRAKEQVNKVLSSLGDAGFDIARANPAVLKQLSNIVAAIPFKQ